MHYTLHGLARLRGTEEAYFGSHPTARVHIPTLPRIFSPYCLVSEQS